jgi:hypothetical protein
MSTNVTPTIDVELDTTEVTNLDSTGQITAPATTEINLSETTSNVEGYKKEYSVIGDGLYASLSVDEAPLWLTSLVDAVVNASIANGMTNYDLLVQDVRNAIDSIDVAKNTYVEQIDVTTLIDGIVTSKLETLNATYEGAFATKAELSTAVATATQSLAQDITDLSVGFGEDLTSRITAVQLAYADEDSALADDITALESAFEDQESNVEAVSTATSGLQTYVGLTEDGVPNGTGILSSVALLQKQADGLIETFVGTHELVNNDMDGNIDTNELRTNQWPYALWLPMEGTVDPTFTTRTAYKDNVAASYPVPEHTVYKNTANNTFWEYHPVTYGGWEQILETEYLLRKTTVRDSHLGDSYIRYEIVNGATSYEESYKFVKIDVDTSSPFNTDSEGYSWAVVSDTPADAAYIEALNAYALADGKVSQFYAWGGPYAPADYTVTNPDDTTETINGDDFSYWFKANGELQYKVNNAWVAVPIGYGDGPHIAEGDVLTVFDPDTRDYTNYRRKGTSWAQVGPTGIIAKSKFFVDLDADVNGADGIAAAQANLEITVETYAKSSNSEKLSGLSALDVGWTTDASVTYAESDANPIGACQTFTYAEAVAFAESKGLRLPTLLEVKGGLGQGTGCSYDSAQIWTSTPGVTPGTHYSCRGNYSDPDTDIIEEDDTAVRACRFVADSHDKLTAATLHAQTKFEYNAPVTINGITQNAGFGLVNELSSVENGPATGSSEFWVAADRFKIMNPDNTANYAAFSINDDGGLTLSTSYTEATRNEPRGAYNSSTSYVRGDVVTFNNSSYTALKSLTNVTPSNDGVNWQLLASQGMTALLYEWEGSDAWPASTTEASADTHSFDSNFAGNVIIRVLANDAEGGVRIKFNDSVEVPFSRTLGNATDEWYQFNFTNLVAGTNTIKFWASTGDGGSVKRIEVAFVGAEGVDGAYTDFLFTRKSSTPSDPDGADTWYTNVVDVPSGAGDLWSIKKVVSAGGISTSYVDKRVIDAPIIRELTIYSNATSGTATVPTGSTYNFSTDSLSIGTNPTNFTWSRSLPGLNNTGEKIYVSTGLVTGNATQTSVSISWSDPVVYTQKTNGDIYREVVLYANASSSPTKPGATAGWNTSGSSVDIGATDTTPAWTVNPATPSVGELTWRTQITLRQPQGSGNWETVDSEWGTPVQLTGLSGEATDTIYTVSTTAPATPAASSTTPSGWSATLPTKVDNIWVSIGTKGQGGTTYTWGAPVMLSEHTPNMLLAQKTLPWPIGTGSADTEGGTWTYSGLTTENSRALGTDPFGGTSVIWTATNNDTSTGHDGGFKGSPKVEIDSSKTYRFTLFMKQESTGAVRYFGCHAYTDGSNTAVTTNTGSNTTNPYFRSSFDLPSNDEWYLLVGFLKPYGSTETTNRAETGIWRVSDGVQVSTSSFNDFRMSSEAINSAHIRAFYYNDSSTSARSTYFWGPRIDVMDDRAPTITDLLRKTLQGQTYKEIFLYANAAEAPTLPPVADYFDATTGSSAVVADATWTPSVGSPDTGESTWRTSLTLVKVSDQTPWTNHDGSWNTAIKVSGHDGVSYTGTTEYYKLTNSDTAPDRYSSDTTIDTGWSTSPSSPTSSNRYLWNFNRNSRSDGSFDDSSVSLITSMVKSISSITEYYQLGTSATTAPTDTWQTSIANAGAISDSKPYLWNKTVIAYTDGSTSTTTYTLIAAKGAEGYTPVKGTDYFDGAPGSPGAGFYHTAAYTSTSSTNSTITSRFTTVVGRAPVAGDVFTQEASDGSTLTKRYDGSEWEAPALIIDGSMIVDGSVTADHLAVNSLSAVNADMGTITAGTLQNSTGTFILDLTAGTITIKTS